MAAATHGNLDYVAAERAALLTETLLGKDGQQGIRCKKEECVKPADADNLVTKSLGVISESGLFACGLFLLAKSGMAIKYKELKPEEVVARHILSALIDLATATIWEGVQPKWTDSAMSPESLSARKRQIIDYLVGISALELPRLLLIRQVWEQTLTYSRYMMRSLREKD